MNTQFSSLLLDWYHQNARSLPWRGHPDPYAVWVSEIMLQQTRVDTVIPYFTRWLRRFPDIQTLSTATEDEILSEWEGLGYYGRARNLHKAAKIVVDNFKGQVPDEFQKLLSLPGIGKYTAAAIASIAFDQDHAVVDGNVKRVLSRVLNFRKPVNTPEAEKDLYQLAQELLPHGQSGDYNQAIMDLGAMICLPRSPVCSNCPVKNLCWAFDNDGQHDLPVVSEKPPIPHFIVTAAILHLNENVLIAKRPSKGLLGGLWEFPGGKVEHGETHEQALAREVLEELGVVIQLTGKLGEYRHAYTHFRITLHAYHAELVSNEPRPIEASELRWVIPADLQHYPMGKIDRMISQDLVKENG